MLPKFKKILVFRIGHLGDTLVTLPAFWTIRRSFPDSKIALLSNSNPGNPNYIAASNVLPAEGLFDETITYPSGISLSSYLSEMIGLSRSIRRFGADAIIYLVPRIRSRFQIRRDIAFFRFSGIKQILGTEYLMHHLLPPRAVAPAQEIISESDHFLKVLSSCGITPDIGLPADQLLLTAIETSKAEEFIDLANYSGPEDRPIIGIAPGSKWESKIWDEENFFNVVNKLIQARDVLPIIFGGPEDQEKGERLIRQWGRGANAAGRLSVRESAAALRKCTIYLGNDTGTMHLAAAVGTPCVAIFAAIDYPGRWYPTGYRHFVFREPVPCEGCQSPICPYENLCLQKVDVKSVFESCLQAIDSV